MQNGTGANLQSLPYCFLLYKKYASSFDDAYKTRYESGCANYFLALNFSTVSDVNGVFSSADVGPLESGVCAGMCISSQSAAHGKFLFLM